MSEQSDSQGADVISVDKPVAIEQQITQVDSAIHFAKYLTARYPQVDAIQNIAIELDGESTQVNLPEPPEGIKILPQLNYYLVGSLATTLLSRAETIDLCEETTGSNITVTESVANPQATRDLLAEFARPIGDIDYVPTVHYRELQKVVQDSFDSVSSEEYQRGRAKYLWKGGGGPKYGEIPPEATLAIKREPDRKDDFGIMCDPVEIYGTRKFARINIEGNEFFVARPDTLVSYKILHMLQSYDQKPDKFNKDFAKLHQAMTKLYTDDEMVELTHKTISEYEASMSKISSTFDKNYHSKLPAMTSNLLNRSDLSDEARGFIEKVVAFDQINGSILGQKKN